MDAVATLFASLYESFSVLPAGERGRAWADFVRVEGLRVEDLDPRPGDDVVRVFACALYGEGLPSREVAAVVGKSQRTVSHYVKAAGLERRRGRPRAAVTALPGTATAEVESSRVYEDDVLADVMAWAASQERDPGSSLVLLERQLKDAPVFVEECREVLGRGVPVGVGFERNLRRCATLLEGLLGEVHGLGLERGVRL